MRIVSPGVTLVCSTPNAAEFIERVGRVCYKSEDKITPDSAGKFIKMLLERGHESVIEHAHASFLVVCDRGVSHEFVRHRIFSYSQESTRYCNYAKTKHGNEITVIEPPGLFGDARQAWTAAVSMAESSYLMMISLGVKPEIARSVLPNCLKTELVGTANFREWRHFLRMRAVNPKAHPQMREIAIPIGRALFELCPPVFEDFREKLEAS